MRPERVGDLRDCEGVTAWGTSASKNVVLVTAGYSDARLEGLFETRRRKTPSGTAVDIFGSEYGASALKPRVDKSRQVKHQSTFTCIDHYGHVAMKNHVAAQPSVRAHPAAVARKPPLRFYGALGSAGHESRLLKIWMMSAAHRSPNFTLRTGASMRWLGCYLP